jgi:hypothetical protein
LRELDAAAIAKYRAENAAALALGITVIPKPLV